MFKFLQKKVDPNVYAPVSGKCIDIEKVSDVTFSSKCMGDGVAIVPEEGLVSAPFDGEIVMMFPTLHAFGIRRNDGVEALIHIGIDTVEANGVGFEKLASKNQKISKGDPIIRFDKEKLSKEYDMTTMVIMTGEVDKGLKKLALDQHVSASDAVMTA